MTPESAERYGQEQWVKKWERGLKIQKAVDYGRCVSDRMEQFFGAGIYDWLYIYEEGGASAMCVKEGEWQAFCAYYRNAFAHDATFLGSLADFEKRYQPHLNLLSRIEGMDLGSLSNEELGNLFTEYKISLADYFSPMATVVYWESVIEDAISGILKKHFGEADMAEKTSIVLAMTEPNYLLREALGLAAVARRPDNEQEAALREHAAAYAYIPMYDYDYAPYTLQYFKDRLQGIDRDEAAKTLERVQCDKDAFEVLVSDNRFDDFERLQLRTLHMLVNHKDERSHYRSIESFRGRVLYEEIGRRISTSLGELMFMLDEEIMAALGGALPAPVVERAKKHCLTYECGRVHIYTGADMDEFLTQHLAKPAQEQVRGTGVSAGVVRGKVRIVKTIRDLDAIQDGDILVTSMTRPDYIAAMKKAAAFVTDEGGILCHAAIVSRELKKPCVVGTRVATQVLKDGDLVEVDADSGVVRTINK